MHNDPSKTASSKQPEPSLDTDAPDSARAETDDSLTVDISRSDRSSSITPLHLLERIGRYPVVRLLGEGGFGRVYLAKDERLDKLVAIKVAKKPLIGALTMGEAYLAEARNLARLEHPHIIQVYDVQIEDEQPYIVMKFVEGYTLKEWVDRKQPGIREIVTVLLHVAEALEFAHRNNLVHRDLKPDNVLIDRHGSPHVSDFGLAIHFDGRSDWEGIVTGTLPYMSPEQVRGEAHRIDGRSDVWSFGVLMYEQLAGCRPFSGSDTKRLREAIAKAEPPPLRMRNPSIPRELERICTKCLQERRSDRYSTFYDLIEDLRHWLDPPQGGHPTPVIEKRDTAKMQKNGNGNGSLVPKGPRSFTADDAEYFIDLLPGPRDRSGLPESIRFWKTRLEEPDPERTFSVGLIYGPSGCGKSSLVQAGLIPRLASHVSALYINATPEDTEQQLMRRLVRQLPPQVVSDSMPATFLKLRQTSSYDCNSGSIPSINISISSHLWTGKPPGKLVIFLDQFEQWLHAHPNDYEGELLQALRQCDGGCLQAILMVRDDFAMAAARFMNALDVPIQQGQNFATVDLFSLQHAEKVLRQFGQAYGALPSDENQLTADQRHFIASAAEGMASGGGVVPVRLALFAEMVKDKPWLPATLIDVGGTTGIGINFLEETFCSRSANPRYRLHERAARQVLAALLPEVGVDIKRGMQPVSTLQRAAEYENQPAEFQDLRSILDHELRLITPTDPETLGLDPRNATAQGGYQLTHDYLVPALRAWLTRRQSESMRGRAALRLAERSELWNSKPSNQLLPPLWEYLNTSFFTSRRVRTAPQHRMMQSARRYFISRTAVALIALLLLLIGAYEGIGRFQARQITEGLFSANEDDVFKWIEKLRPYKKWARPLLEAGIRSGSTSNGGVQRRLNAQLALVHDQPGLTGDLLDALLGDKDKYLGVILQALTPHRSSVIDPLWREMESGENPERRFRAGIALANIDPASSNWSADRYRFLAEQLVNASLESQLRIRKLLDPVKEELVSPLEALFRDAKSERQMEGTAKALADYADQDEQRILTLLCVASPLQYHILFPLIRERDFDRSTLREHLRQQAAQMPSDNLGSFDRVALGKARSGAAITLLKCGFAGEALDALVVTDDPEALTQFIHGCRERDVRPSMLISLRHEVDKRRMPMHLSQNPDDSRSSIAEPLPNIPAKQVADRMLYAIILALGDYRPQEIPTQELENTVSFLVNYGYELPSSQVHAAARWLLTKWEQSETVERLELAARPYREDKEWFRVQLSSASPDNVTDEGPQESKDVMLTFVVFPAGEYLVGSPEDERGRHPRENQAVIQLPRPFAIMDRELTYEDLRRLGETISSKADPSSAMTGYHWYDAIELCRQMSKRYGFPDEDQVYPDPETLDRQQYPRLEDKLAEGLPANWPMRWDRPGFRLPMEVEWEIACRGGMRTAYGFGGDASLLKHYAWFQGNVDEDRPGCWPPRLLRPNHRGLFDMHGNVWEWCYDPYEDPESDMRLDDAPFHPSIQYRVTRGGWKLDRDMIARSAYRSRFPALSRSTNVGLRLAVSLTPDWNSRARRSTVTP